MGHFSLRYRIAAIIFLLEAVMMAVVLGVTLQEYFNNSKAQAGKNEQVTINLLADLSRIALFNAEYGELQPYIEEVVQSPEVERVLLMDAKGRVVVSSNVADVGAVKPDLKEEGSRFWRVHPISNAAGDLGVLAINFSHDNLLQTNDKALQLGIRTALVGMTIIAIVGVIIGFLLTRRMAMLTQAAHRLASGDLTVKTGLRGRDEVGLLGEVFDQMTESIRKYVEELHESQDELKHAHDELEERIKERTSELAEARDQALRSNRYKSIFLANMSHELRTPLNAIIGYSDLLTEIAHEEGYELAQRDLGKISFSARHLLSVINDILDLSKIEAGKVEMHYERIDISGLVNDLMSSVQSLMMQNNNTFKVRCENDIGFMVTDLIKMRQILINLLGNASKFTADGIVELSVFKDYEQEPHQVIFHVRDTGIGIVPEKLRHLFDEFSQADSSTTRRYGGTGLGLTISKRYCEMLGGKIEVDSAPGQGSDFKVTVPINPGLLNDAPYDMPEDVGEVEPKTGLNDL